jgi:cell fate regulator YaaT (PSP1 superfamily)
MIPSSEANETAHESTTPYIEVEFKGNQRSVFPRPGEYALVPGDWVVAERESGRAMGRVSLIGTLAEMKARRCSKFRLLRKATEEDLRIQKENENRERDAFRVCEERIAERGLEMKLVDVECNLDSGRLTFFFTAAQRVDFRALVRDLASIFKTRIELRQIGVRDEAKRMCGLGSCGRKFCCSSFLTEFEPVTLKMAREQHLSPNPAKISGACGRLMCCLVYEREFYREASRKLPRVGSKVWWNGQERTVSKVDLFSGIVDVTSDDGSVDHVPGEELRARKERLPRRFFRRRSGGRGRRSEGRSGEQQGGGESHGGPQ